MSEEADALAGGDMDTFLSLVRESGRSSWELLQDITPTGAVREQAMAVALTVAERALNGRGACRVHGGGFAGTIQAFVPLDHCWTAFQPAGGERAGRGQLPRAEHPSGGRRGPLGLIKRS